MSWALWQDGSGDDAFPDKKLGGVQDRMVGG